LPALPDFYLFALRWRMQRLCFFLLPVTLILNPVQEIQGLYSDAESSSA
jgi:hypothetical protein